MTIKEKGKTKSRWIVCNEDRLLVYKDPDDGTPLSTYSDISSWDVASKGTIASAM